MKLKTFLIKTTKGKEAVMRLPVTRYEAITPKGRDMIANRFYDGTTKIKGRLQYALNLEAYSNASDLIKALTKYQKNII